MNHDPFLSRRSQVLHQSRDFEMLDETSYQIVLDNLFATREELQWPVLWCETFSSPEGTKLRFIYLRCRPSLRDIGEKRCWREGAPHKSD